MGLKRFLVRLGILIVGVVALSFVLSFVGWDGYAIGDFATRVASVGLAAIAFCEGLDK